MAAARPMVTVQSVDGSASTEQIALPAVFSAPLRSDIVVQVGLSDLYFTALCARRRRRRQLPPARPTHASPPSPSRPLPHYPRIVAGAQLAHASLTLGVV